MEENINRLKEKYNEVFFINFYTATGFVGLWKQAGELFSFGWEWRKQ
jgi:hypothetical protein